MLRPGEKVYTPLVWTGFIAFECVIKTPVVPKEQINPAIAAGAMTLGLTVKEISSDDPKFQAFHLSQRLVNYPHRIYIITSTIVEALYDYKQERITKYEHDHAPEIVRAAGLKDVMENETHRSTRFYSMEAAGEAANIRFKNLKSRWDYDYRKYLEAPWTRAETPLY